MLVQLTNLLSLFLNICLEDIEGKNRKKLTATGCVTVPTIHRSCFRPFCVKENLPPPGLFSVQRSHTLYYRKGGERERESKNKKEEKEKKAIYYKPPFMRARKLHNTILIYVYVCYVFLYPLLLAFLSFFFSFYPHMVLPLSSNKQN